MKIKRILENIKWLFNHPPTSITGNVPKDVKCHFCGADNGLTNYEGMDFAICHNCVIKAYKKILAPK